jgi:hypothetical protein
MATLTNLASAFTTTAGNKTAQGTPAVDDLVCCITACTGTTTSAFGDDQGGSFTKIATFFQGAGSTNPIDFWVRSALITSSVLTTYTATQTGSTGGGLRVVSVTGMSLAGTAAIRSSGGQSVQTGTPAPVLSQTPLSANAILEAVLNATNPAGLTDRAGYTSMFDGGYNTPATGLHLSRLNSGETSATLTMGSASASTFGSIAIEFDTSGAAATSLVLSNGRRKMAPLLNR